MAKKHYRHVFNLQFYKPALWERVVLYFWPMICTQHDDTKIEYKSIGNRLYIYHFQFAQSVHCALYNNFKDN